MNGCSSGNPQRIFDTYVNLDNTVIVLAENTFFRMKSPERLGDLGEEMMGKALAGLDAKSVGQMNDRMKRIKSNIKSELNSKG